MQPPTALAHPLTIRLPQIETASLRKIIDREIVSALNDCPAHLHRQVYACPNFQQRLTAFILNRLSNSVDIAVEPRSIQHIAQSGIHYLLHEETLQKMRYKN
jgi:hypothetical protein